MNLGATIKEGNQTFKPNFSLTPSLWGFKKSISYDKRALSLYLLT